MSVHSRRAAWLRRFALVAVCGMLVGVVGPFGVAAASAPAGSLIVESENGSTLGNAVSGFAVALSPAEDHTQGRVMATKSSGGQDVVFSSLATNLGTTTSGSYRNVYVASPGVTPQLISCPVSGSCGTATGSSQDGVVSSDDQLVVFDSFATDLVSPATTGRDVFVWNRAATSGNGLTLVSKSGSTEGNGASWNPSIGGPDTNGKYWVAFESLATNLTSGDTNGVADVFETS